MRGRLITCVSAFTAALTAQPALAQEARPALAEVMQGAVAMTSVGGFLFVAGAEQGWVCAVNVSSKHFAALADGDDVVAEQTVPAALCVPATHFTNLAE